MHANTPTRTRSSFLQIQEQQMFNGFVMNQRFPVRPARRIRLASSATSHPYESKWYSFPPARSPCRKATYKSFQNKRQERTLFESFSRVCSPHISELRHRDRKIICCRTSNGDCPLNRIACSMTNDVLIGWKSHGDVNLRPGRSREVAIREV